FWGSGRGGFSLGRAPKRRYPARESLDFPVLPRHQQLAGVEDGGVGADGDTNQQGEHKLPGGGATKEEQREQGNDDRERRIDGPDDRLRDRVVHDAFEGLFWGYAEVLPNPVEHHDGVVHREADDRQQRRDE